MQLRKPLTLALILLLILAAATSAIANDDERFRHSVRYDLGGHISLNRILGDDKDTGGEKKQTITGYADLNKWEDVRMAQSIMTTDEEISWTVPADAPGGLAVTTTLDWASRAMARAATDYVYNGYNIRRGDIVNPYILPVVEGLVAVNSMTGQDWFTRITTDPGNSGLYEMEFFAAYGPGPHEESGVLTDAGILYFYDEEYMWRFDDTREDGIHRGKKYVGNYFHIKQHAMTQDGRLVRRFSMSDPFSGNYYVEELDVTGQASVRETFEVDILEAGRDAITLKWHDVF